MLEKYIEIIKPNVYEIFKDDNTGHDMNHLERTMKLALYIQKYEGGDKIIIGLAAYLHDVHRIIQNRLNRFVSPKESLTTIKPILDKLDLSDDQKDKILYAIEHHEEYNWNNNNIHNIETLILQDADNLDVIGAIGVARSFTYGATYDIPMYDSTIPLNTNNDYTETVLKESSTIHHFYHKLLKVGDYMNTKTGMKLAQKRQTFMREFAEEFIDEWNGNYEKNSD